MKNYNMALNGYQIPLVLQPRDMCWEPCMGVDIYKVRQVFLPTNCCLSVNFRSTYDWANLSALQITLLSGHGECVIILKLQLEPKTAFVQSQIMSSFVR